MYYPIQLPYILHEEFSNSVCYSERVCDALSDFVLCFWEMLPRSDTPQTVEHIIVTDGCIDLVVDFDQKSVGFSGMSRTDFHFTLSLPTRFLGARLVPGAFYQLTGIPSHKAMDNFIPLEQVDTSFDQDHFFSLPFEEARDYFTRYFLRLTKGHSPDAFTELFHQLQKHPPATTAALYEQLHFSSRQCQRLFHKHFGLTPKMVLSILRFQKCLEILTSGRARPSDVLEVVQYYDQPHFIKDFKRNLGITPLILLARYKG